MISSKKPKNVELTESQIEESECALEPDDLSDIDF